MVISIKQRGIGFFEATNMTLVGPSYNGPILGCFVKHVSPLHCFVLHLEGKERLGSFKRKLYDHIGSINKSHHPYIMNFNVPKFPRMLGAI
jgi:hypothetical protein